MSRTKFEQLPDEIILEVFLYLHIHDLQSVSKVCKRFNYIASCNSIWKKLFFNQQSMNGMINISERSLCSCHKGLCSYNPHIYSFKHCVKLSLRWNFNISEPQSGPQEFTLFKFPPNIKLLPYMKQCGNNLWVSVANEIRQLKLRSNGRLQSKVCVYSGGLNGSHDICRFVLNNDLLVAGDTRGSLHMWNISGRVLDSCKLHNDELGCVDMVGNTIITGSRDGFFQVSTWNENHLKASKLKVNMGARVWSLALEPQDGRWALIGSSGLNQVYPLQLYDLERSCKLYDLMEPQLCRPGASVFDIHWESPHIAITAGHDTFIRVWDLRIPGGPCNQEWCCIDTDTAIYSVRGDANCLVVAGTARHSLTVVFDRRNPTKLYKNFFSTVNNAKMRSSPVYSLCYNPRQMFVALDSQVVGYNFDY